MPISQSTYTSIVTAASAYPGAILVEDFGTYCKTFIQTLCGYSPSNVLLADSICSDDANAPAYYNNNIGQMPASLNDFQGPFFAGGIGGYPHTGRISFFAWASHIQYTTNGALMLFSAPHIGVCSLSGSLGYMLRRGQGNELSNTCGAVGVAVNRIVNPAVYGTASNSLSVVTPLSSDPFPFGDGGFGFGSGNNYQQYVLNKILWDDTTTRMALTANYVTSLQTTSGIGARMKLATESIRVATSTEARADLTAAMTLFSPAALSADVFVVNGTFINVDDSYQAYIQVNSFELYKTATNTFTNYTVPFTAQWA